MAAHIKSGDTVYVPWGLDEPVRATVVEVWGDPPAHLRVQLHPVDADEADEAIVILISPSVLTAA